MAIFGSSQGENHVALATDHFRAAVVDAIGTNAVDDPLAILNGQPKRMAIEGVKWDGVQLGRDEIVQM
jgi:hypothetical protein